MEEEKPKKKLRLPFKIDLQLFITIVVTVSVGINVNLIFKLDDIKYEIDFQETNQLGTERVSEFFTPIPINRLSTSTKDYSEDLKEIKELLNEIGITVERNEELNKDIYGAAVDKLLPIR